MSGTDIKSGSITSISSPKRQSDSSEQEKALVSPKRQSDERHSGGPSLGPDGKPLLPPLGPDGKPLFPPLGPDGKPIHPPLGPDGKPLPPPRLGSDGKPLPPPIIGPDGKELERPTDKDGKPLPVYITKEGKAVLDEQGNPIALKFDAEGKPIPLPPPAGQPTGDGNAGGSGGHRLSARDNLANMNANLKEQVPGFLVWIGVVDLVLSKKQIKAISKCFKT